MRIPGFLKYAEKAEIGKFYSEILNLAKNDGKLLAVLVDPEKLKMNQAEVFLNKLPAETSHIFVGRSTGAYEEIKNVVESLKRNTYFLVFLFPGSYHQIKEKADALLFLSLISGNNLESLIG